MRNRAWLLAAVLLLGIAAWLMSRSDTGAAEPRRPRVEFPRYQKREDQERSRRRRTLPPAPATTPDDAPRPKRDPVITALPSTKGKSAVVFEASALRDSPIGRHWLDCMASAYELRRLERFRNEFGVDLLEDVDRIAFSSEKVLVVSGDFSGARWDSIGASPRVYGDKGVVFDEDPRGGGRAEGFGIWNDEIVLLASDRASIEAAMDRLEDRAPPSQPRIPDWASYGDIYGFLSAEDLAMMLPEEERAIAERLRGAVDDVELHVDASEDVAITADVQGTNAADVEDLSKSLGGALALARLKAQADGETDLAELLDFAKISPRGGRSSIDLALPLDVLIQKMGPCRRDAGAEPP
jgi:hypothetical protein